MGLPSLNILTVSQSHRVATVSTFCFGRCEVIDIFVFFVTRALLCCLLLSGPATPHHNNAVLSDLTLLKSHGLIDLTLQKHEGIRQGIALLKVWLNQRQYNVVSDTQ